MSTVNVVYGTRTEFANDSNLNSLSSGQAKQIGVIDNHTALNCGFKIEAYAKLATTGVTSTGTLTFYACESSDGSSYVDGINTTATTDQTSSIKNAPVVKTAQANANSQVVDVMFDFPSQCPPRYVSILVSNGSGATLSSSAHSAYFTPYNWTVA
jgi:hypothetical protein